ncbi:MAG: PASTA domain-containing protein [Solirubrobacterales bacterium]
MTPSTTSLQTFPTNLPIQAGDLIGIDNTNKEDELGLVEIPGASFAAWVPPLGDGVTAPPKETNQKFELGFNAVVQPAPTLTAISPTSGSIKGGTAVTISGTDFANVSGVSFGLIPAKGFTVTNEGQLTAVAPASKKAHAVDVTVTTIAGTTPLTATDKFKYKACVVPKLNGKKLKAAKKKLRKASCKLGKVKLRGDATAKTGKVVKQSPKPRKQLAPGSKVNVTLGSAPGLHRRGEGIASEHGLLSRPPRAPLAPAGAVRHLSLLEPAQPGVRQLARALPRLLPAAVDDARLCSDVE